MRFLRAGAMLTAVTVLIVPGVSAQEEPEGPGSRILTVTTFDVPFQDRGTVIPFMRKYVIPYTQLNPAVKNFRVAFHNWGANADQVLIISEYEDIADIEADCGQPCDDYESQNESPEEGDAGYEEFQEAQRLWSKYYSDHQDEIYVMPMGVAKVEGEMMGEVGLPEPDEGGN